MKKYPARLISLPALLLLSSPALSGESKPASAPATAPASAPATAPASVPANNSVQTPMDDLNLRKRAIPAVLLEAVEKPYSLEGLSQCSQLVTAVEALNTAIGKDIDLPQDGGNRLAASDLADFAASTFIPFRDVIRQVSGANNRQRQLQEAVLAGFARRSFLKGVGATRNCPYPARPADAHIVAAQAAALMASLETLCGPLPNGQKRSAREEWLNNRKCNDYRRAKQEAAATAPVAPASTSPSRKN